MQLRSEADRVFGGKPVTADVAKLAELRYAEAFLFEAMRLSPPVHNLTRYTREEVQIGGFTVPAGVDVLLSVYAMHVDEQVWGPDVLDFRPERFLEDDEGTEKRLNSFFFQPGEWVGQ